MSEITVEEAKKLKVVDLKSELQKRSLDTKGKKSELLERLLEALGESAEHVGDMEDSQDEDEVDASSLPVELDTSESAPADEAEADAPEESMDETAAPEEPVVDDTPAEQASEAKEESKVNEAKPSEEAEKDANDESMQVLDEAVADERDILEVPVQPEDRDENLVVWDSYNSDLHFRLEVDGVTGSSQSAGGLFRLWGGARSNYGAKSGKVFFHVRVEEGATIEEDLEEPTGVRVGFSSASFKYGLGDEVASFGYASKGQSVNNLEVQPFGCTYGVGDTITACLDLESDVRAISFLVNGEQQGVAFTLPESIEPGTALFPHVEVKNLKVVASFDGSNSDFAAPQGYQSIGSLDEEAKCHGVCGPSTAADASVLMLVGLPAIGKTTWARNYASENADKRFNVIGVDHIIERMRVSGSLNSVERWQKYTQTALDVQNKLICLAEKRCRNYIMDQTNVYNSVQRRRMQPFLEYGTREAIVLVNENAVLAERTLQRERETGKLVPTDAVNRMVSNFVLPQLGRTFTAVTYPDCDASKAKQLLRDLQSDAQASRSLPGSAKRPRYPSSSGYGRNSHEYDSRDRRGSGSYGSGRDSRDYGGGRRDYTGHRDSYADRSRSASSSGSGHRGNSYYDRYGSSGYDRPPPPSDRRPPPAPRYESSYSRKDYGSSTGGGGGGSYGGSSSRGGGSSYGRPSSYSGGGYSGGGGGSSYSSGSSGGSYGGSSYTSRYDQSSSPSYSSRGAGGSSYNAGSSYSSGGYGGSGSSSYGGSGGSGYGGSSGTGNYGSGSGGSSYGSGSYGGSSSSYGGGSGSSSYGSGSGSSYGGGSSYGSGSSGGGYGGSSGGYGGSSSSYGGSGSGSSSSYGGSSGYRSGAASSSYGASSGGYGSGSSYGASSYGRGGGSSTSYGQSSAGRPSGGYGQSPSAGSQSSYGGQSSYRPPSGSSGYGSGQQYSSGYR